MELQTCECEYLDCMHSMIRSDVLKKETTPMDTIYGVFKICSTCRREHPIHTKYLTKKMK